MLVDVQFTCSTWNPLALLWLFVVHFLYFVGFCLWYMACKFLHLKASHLNLNKFMCVLHIYFQENVLFFFLCLCLCLRIHKLHTHYFIWNYGHKFWFTKKMMHFVWRKQNSNSAKTTQNDRKVKWQREGKQLNSQHPLVIWNWKARKKTCCLSQ